jgi:hypothetical protein
MINLDVKWSDPYEIESKSGIPLWTRHWLIPVNYRNEFFVYWKGNSFKLKDKGYGVKKVDNDWFLTETHTTKDSFSKKKTTITPMISKYYFYLKILYFEIDLLYLIF